MSIHSIAEGHAFFFLWLLKKENHALGGPTIAKIKPKTKATRRWTLRRGMKKPNPYGDYKIVHAGTKEWR